MLTSSSSFITENNGNKRKQRKLGGGSVLCLLKDFVTQTEKITSISVSSELFLFHFRYGESFKNYLKMPCANFLIIIYNGKQRKHTEITEILGDSFRSVLAERFRDTNRKITSISAFSELFLFHFRYGESFKNFRMATDSYFTFTVRRWSWLSALLPPTMSSWRPGTTRMVLVFTSQPSKRSRGRSMTTCRVSPGANCTRW